MVIVLKFILYSLNIIIGLLISTAYIVLMERKIMASMQRRKGPNVVGIFGLLQPLADGLKLFLKEIIFPSYSNWLLFFLSSLFSFFCSLIIWVTLPIHFGVSILDLNMGILYVLLISSINVYSIVFSGWASNSKYAFLGGIRSIAQMISYELVISTIISVIVLFSGSMHLGKIVMFQTYVWFVFPLFPLWIIFMISCLAETNRAPFDLPESESELVAGYNVEYSSIPFALFFFRWV